MTGSLKIPDVDDSLFVALVARAAGRYARASVTARQFASGKLRADPLYRAVVLGRLLPAGGVLVDIGCGQGLTLALLAEAAAASRAGEWPDRTPAPVFDRLVGIEVRPRIAAIAKQALGHDATIVCGDARASVQGPCRAVLLFDVLHMMPGDDQIRVLRTAARALEPGGTILVREADAAAGWRFTAVHAGNRLKALLFGNWRQTFHFRTAEEWRFVCEDAGFDVDLRLAGDGTPFGNVLLILTSRARGSA